MFSARNAGKRFILKERMRLNNIMENIRLLRLERGLTQRELGALCGLKQQYINQVESGKVVPTVRTYEKIIDALGFSLTLKRK